MSSRVDERPADFWQRVCDSTVPGVERARLGQWWLRADLGETGRANSVWAVGDPGRSIGAAIDAVQSWYGNRGLVPTFQLFRDSDPRLVAELERRSWGILRGADVLAVDLVAALGSGIAREADDGAVVIGSEPSPAFNLLTNNPNRVAEMMRTSDRRWFASLSDPNGQALGCGLAIRAEASIGIFAMMTAPAARRRGIARRILASLLSAGLADGAEAAFLQVMSTNTAAQALYRSIGFRLVEHYEYRIPLDK